MVKFAGVLTICAPALKTFEIFFILLLGTITLHAQNSLPDTWLRMNSPERVLKVGYLLLDRYGGQPDSLRHYIRLVKEFAGRHHDQPLLQEVLFIEKIQSTLNEQDAAKRWAVLEQLATRDYAGEPLYRARCLHLMGQNEFVMEQYAQAFENLEQARKIFERVGYDKVPAVGRFLHDLALDYFYFKDYDEVIRLMSLSVTLPPANDNLDIQRYNTLALAYSLKGQSDSALVFYQKALDKAQLYKNPSWQGLVSGNIGEIFYRNKQYQQALPYLLRDYRINLNENKLPESIRNVCSTLATIYLETDSLDKALFYIRQMMRYFPERALIRYGEQQQYEISKKKYFEVRYRYHQKTGEWKDALNYLDSLRRAELLENEKYNISVLKLEEGRRQLQESWRLVAQREKEKAGLKLRYSLWIFVLLLLGGMGYVLFYRTVIKKRKERDLYMARQEVARLEKEKIEAALYEAQKEMAGFIDKIQEKNRLMEKVFSTLKKQKSGIDLPRSTLDQALTELRTSRILTADDWTLFQDSFNTLHPHFTELMRFGIPGITPSESRYLMLCKIGLSHADMAQALGVSTDAIRVTWNRLRKKCKGLASESPQLLIRHLEA